MNCVLQMGVKLLKMSLLCLKLLAELIEPNKGWASAPIVSEDDGFKEEPTFLSPDSSYTYLLGPFPS